MAKKDKQKKKLFTPENRDSKKVKQLKKAKSERRRPQNINQWLSEELEDENDFS